MIRFDQVYKRYNGDAVVADFSLEVTEGEFFVLIGPSGSGKTTTLKMINKLIDLSEGTITIEDKKLVPTICRNYGGILAMCCNKLPFSPI